MDVSTSVVGESIAAERDARMEDNSGESCVSTRLIVAFETSICRI